jgi:hypothetical protein
MYAPLRRCCGGGLAELVVLDVDGGCVAGADEGAEPESAAVLDEVLAFAAEAELFFRAPGPPLRVFGSFT